MSKKNRFSKHKSRKYRKLHNLPNMPPRQNPTVPEPGIEEVQEEMQVDELLKPEEEEAPGVHQEPRGKFKPKPKISNSTLRSSLQDLRQAMYLSLGFTVFLIVLYILKLKTNLFTLGVDYLYRAMRF